MKNIIVVSVLCLLAGCWQTVDSYDIRKAVEKCGSINNVHQIKAYTDGSEAHICFVDNTK